MTKEEIIEKLIVICNNKIVDSQQKQNNKKTEIFKVILNILKTPQFYLKQDIEVTVNILKDLEIEEYFMVEILKVFYGE